jgi:S1-C subfamily serine protease
VKWLALACLVGACAPAVRPDYPPPDPDERPIERAPRRRPAGGGGLSRQALEATLAEGPGAFLGRIRVRALVVGKAFKGWRIESLWPDAEAEVELRPGDVVTRLNGRTLEKPDDVSALWQSLHDAREITVDYERGGETRTMRVPVSD